MKLDNQTPFPAMIFRGGIDESRFCASVTARITYQLDADSLEIASEQSWIVSSEPWEGPHGGPMESDELFYKGGTDVLIFGSAQPSVQDPTRGRVEVSVGNSFRHAIAVFGDRVWAKQGDQLRPSAPQPFESVPLTLEHAFGGKDTWDELAIPFPGNPDGRGYYVDADSAVGKPLPNLENPQALIQNWTDHPDPVGMGVVPPGFGPRLDRFFVIDETTGAVKRIDPKMFNCAFPDMIAEDASAGDWVQVRGVNPDGQIRFQIPDPGLEVFLKLGDHTVTADLKLDQIGIQCDTKHVFVAWRYPFRYQFIPEEQRECVLRWRDDQAEPTAAGKDAHSIVNESS